MPEITVTTTVTFDPRANWLEKAMLHAATSYWAEGIDVTDDGITLRDKVGGKICAATWDNLAEAIVLISTGRFLWFDGKPVPLKNEYMVQSARDIIARPADADWDTDFDDLVLQMAALKGNLYS